MKRGAARLPVPGRARGWTIMRTFSGRTLGHALVAAAIVPLAVLPVPPAAAAVTCAGLTATIVGTDGNDTIVGTPGADVIAALSGSDRVRGRGGDDVICGGYGADRLGGGTGDDRLFGGPGLYRDDRDGPHLLNDWLRGGPGDDTIIGGEDPRDLPAPIPDVVDYSTAVRGLEIDLTLGTARGQGKDTLSVQAWFVHASDQDDIIIGGPYADHIYGALGADHLEGGPGPDVITADVIGSPDGTADVLLGQGGADYLQAIDGPDLLVGGAGDDELADSGASVDRLLGRRGDDGITDILVPGDGQVLRGGPGDNRLDLRLSTSAGEYVQLPGVLDLEEGTTTVSWSPPVVAVTAGFTNVRMPEGDWTAYGTDADEYFWEAVVGPRTIYAGGGDDYLGGSDSRDHLDGGAGYDRASPLRRIDTCVSIEEVLYGECER